MYGGFRLASGRKAQRVVWLLVLAALIALVVPSVVFAVTGPAASGVVQHQGWSKTPSWTPALPGGADYSSSLAATTGGEVIGEVIVEFARGTQSQAMMQTAGASGATLEWAGPSRSSKTIPFAVYKSSNLNTEQLIAQLKSQPGVVAVSPNHKLRLAGAGYAKPNDPLFDSQWALENTGQVAGSVDADIDARSAWEKTVGSSNVVVAVIDSGVDYEHPDLAANIWKNPGEAAQPYDGIDNDGSGYIDDLYGIDVVNSDSDPFDDNYLDSGLRGHGTHVAGIIAAAAGNGVGITGVAPAVKIMALKAFDSSGNGYESAVIECINYVLLMKSRGVNVVAINASFGEDAAGDISDDPLYDAIKAAGEAGIVFVASADNNGRDIDPLAAPRYPASYDLSSIIAVGASDSYDAMASFSNYGSTSVDLFAPGVDILSTVPPDKAAVEGPDTLFFDDMESGAANWPDPKGTWAITDEAYMSPTQSWSDSPYDHYPRNSQSALTSRTINLGGAAGSGAWLGLGALYEFGRGDGLTVEVSGNNGVSWQELHRFADTGDQYYWVKLPKSALTSTFKLRFVLKAGVLAVGDYNGAFIDDVCITTTAPELYMELSGTSMAAPQVAGTVALLAAVAPSDSMSTRIYRVLSSVDKPATLAGLCVTDGRLNAGRAVAMAASAPTITDVLPKLGSTLGGTKVDIYGSNFYGVSLAGAGGVTFGGVNALSYSVDSSSHIAATAPPGVDGTTVQVQVRAAKVATTDTGADDFTYVAPPTITGITPDTGPDTGGVAVTIFGTNFVEVSSVTFGGTKALKYWLEAPGQLKAIVPAGSAGTVVVQVTAAGGSSPDGVYDSYTYAATSVVQQNDPRLSYLGPWVQAASPAASTGSYVHADLSGSMLTVSFEGTYLALVGRTDSKGGKVLVTLDGRQVGYADFYSDVCRYQQSVYNTGMLSAGPHTLTLERAGAKSAGSKGYVVNVDAVRVLGTVTQAPPAARHQQDVTSFKYMGSWSNGWTWSASGGSFKYANGPGAAVNVTFDGTYLAWIAKKGPGYGKAWVSLDGGQAVLVDLYSSYDQYKQRVYKTGVLDDGKHNLSIYWIGQKNSAAFDYRINIDALDIIGDVTLAPAPQPISWRYEQTDAKITYLGAWSTRSTGSASKGSFYYTSAKGAAANITFSGTTINVLAKVGPVYGKALISLDGGPATLVDLYSAKESFKRSVYKKEGLAPGPHTLVVACAGAKNSLSTGYFVNLDALEMKGYLTQAPKTTRYQQDNAKLNYAGSWTKAIASSASGGSYASANVSGAKVTLTFTGSYLAWIARTTPWYGKAKVTLDGGVPITVDLYSSKETFKKKVYETGSLQNASHTLVIQWMGSKRASASGTTISADAFDVLGTLGTVTF